MSDLPDSFTGIQPNISASYTYMYLVHNIHPVEHCYVLVVTVLNG